MKTIELTDSNGSQIVTLPDEFRFKTDAVAIRREGEAVILEPVKRGGWPVGFFEKIRIDDPSFKRPDQGRTPPIPAMDSSR